MNLPDELRKFKRFAATINFKGAWERIQKLNEADIPDGSDPGAYDLEAALNLRSIIAEICDAIGEFDRAREFVEQSGRFCIASLRVRSGNEAPVNQDRGLTLQRVWIGMQAGMCEYREAKYDSALSKFLLCDEVASSSLLRTAAEERFGTRARALYLLGLTYREQYKLKSSIRCLTASTELAYRSFIKNSTKNSARQKSLLVPVAIARSIGLGLAGVHIILGRYDLAIPLLATAKAMLPSKEKIISTHIDLLMATLPQWSYRQDEREDYIDEKVSRLPADIEIRKCYDAFSLQPHRLYQSRAAYYLSKEYIRNADDARRTRRPERESELLNKAQALLVDLDFSVCKDERFSLLQLALESEIARRREQWKHAEEVATKGLRDTSEIRYPAIHLDLLLARGSARIGGQQYAAAIEDFKTGLALTQKAGNYGLSCIFMLRLSQANAKALSLQEASLYLKQFDGMLTFLEVETADLRALESETRTLLGTHEGDDYVLRLSDNLNPSEEQKHFRRALVRWARLRTTTDAGAANILKITRQTLYNWQR